MHLLLGEEGDLPHVMGYEGRNRTEGKMNDLLIFGVWIMVSEIGDMVCIEWNITVDDVCNCIHNELFCAEYHIAMLSFMVWSTVNCIILPSLLFLYTDLWWAAMGHWYDVYYPLQRVETQARQLETVHWSIVSPTYIFIYIYMLSYQYIFMWMYKYVCM